MDDFIVSLKKYSSQDSTIIHNSLNAVSTKKEVDSVINHLLKNKIMDRSLGYEYVFNDSLGPIDMQIFVKPQLNFRYLNINRLPTYSHLLMMEHKFEFGILGKRITPSRSSHYPYCHQFVTEIRYTRKENGISTLELPSFQ